MMGHFLCFLRSFTISMFDSIFSSPEHKALRVSYCDRPLSVVHRALSVVRQLCYLNIFSSKTAHWILTKLEWSLGGPLPKFFKPFQLVVYVYHGVKNRFSKCNFQKIFVSETSRLRAFIFGIQKHIEVLYHTCLNYSLGVKIDPTPRITILQ